MVKRNLGLLRWGCIPHALFRAVCVLGAVAFAVFMTTPASAQIKSPTAHPDYQVELEPQLLFRFIDEDGLGLGGRATIELGDPAFIPTINNTVGISFGLGFTDGDHCHGRRNCHDDDEFIVPVVMQWNFWFTPHWSAFGEPGLSFEFDGDDDHDDWHDDDDFDIDVAFMVGGRYNFNDNISLTLRLGVPTSSFGVSFFM
jgi:hypothetical protein